MGQIDIRSEMLIEVASMAVLRCRQEMNALCDDVNTVLKVTDEYRRLIRVMDIALNVLEAVADFPSTQLVCISGNGSPCKENDDESGD